MENVMTTLKSDDIKNIILKTCELINREEKVKLDGEYSGMLYRIFITNRDKGYDFELGFGINQSQGGRDVYLDVRKNKGTPNQLIERFVMIFIRTLIEYEEEEIVYYFAISGIHNVKKLMGSIGCEMVNEAENKYCRMNEKQRRLMELCLGFVGEMKPYLGDRYFLSGINYEKTSLPLMRGATISFDVLYKGFQHRVKLENRFDEIIVHLIKNENVIFKQQLKKGEERCLKDYLINLYEDEALHYLVQKPISEFSSMMRKMFNSNVGEGFKADDMEILYKGFENELKKEQKEYDNPYIVVEYIQKILMKKIEDIIIISFSGNNEITYYYGVDSKTKARKKINSEITCWLKRGDIKKEIAKIKMI